MIRDKRWTLAALLCIIAVAALIAPANAQYYSWGADPASLKWRNIKTPEVRLIYPDTVDAVARRTLHYIQSASTDISYGYDYPALKIPFIMHPENFSSNGMVMWLPKRIEFLTSPAVDSYSMPWVKQLVAHEYRHAVQYNNLNKGVVKVMSYILGEQGSTIGLLFLPLYAIEGDAVMSETQMSSFGRGLQPSFTMAYRAIGRDMLSRRNLDRWFCGSYRAQTPDHYHLGYQVTSYAYTRFDENVWNTVASLGVRRPYYIATVSTALKRNYGMNSAQLTRAAFTDLFDYWESLPERENSTEIITPIDTTNYTTYSHPIAIPSGGIISLKEDFSRTERFVINNDMGEERHVSYTGNIATRPTLGDNTLFWSEYRRSTLFPQRINSQLCYMDLEREKTRQIRGLRNVLYPTTIDNSKEHIAYVEYLPNGQFSLIEISGKGEGYRTHKDFKELSRTKILYPTEVHGLAWDNLTKELYFIATDNSGMWLGVRDTTRKEGFRKLQEGAYITLSDLRAEGGKLYYGSIESGYDELHCFDIASGTESRISESKYGSFDPSTPSSDGTIYATTYDRYGYHLSRLSTSASEGEVKREVLPQNIVNPERKKWNVINLDSVAYTQIDSINSHKNHRSRRYNKGIKIINVHSWMPIAYNPFEYAEENRVTVAAGATILSQNLLSTSDGYASYGYNSVEGSMFSAGLKYDGLGVELEAGFSYGGDQVVYKGFSDISTPYQQKYYSVTTSATLPLVFSCGYHTRQLSFNALWNYSNGLVVDLDSITFDHTNNLLTNTGKIGFDEGLQKLTFGVSFLDYVRSAERSFVTPFGYSLSANYAISPSDDNFSDLLVLNARLYTRGFLPTHSATFGLCYQNSIGGYQYKGVNPLSFQSVSLLPVGFSSSDVVNNHYKAASFDYEVPIWYPEGGIGSILYFRRIRLGVGGDYAHFKDNYNAPYSIYSYGAKLVFDINTMRMPDSATSAVNISLSRTSLNSYCVQFGAELPF